MTLFKTIKSLRVCGCQHFKNNNYNNKNNNNNNKNNNYNNYNNKSLSSKMYKFIPILINIIIPIIKMQRLFYNQNIIKLK